MGWLDSFWKGAISGLGAGVPLYDEHKDGKKATGLSADQTIAQIIRGQFADWESTFKPIELNALQQISWNNPQVLTDALKTANENAIGSSNAMAGIMQRQNAARGLTPTSQQSAATGRMLDIDKSLNIAGSENRARMNQRALDERILTGAMPNPQVINDYQNPAPS